MYSFTYKVWYQKIVEILEFLANKDLCYDSWVLGLEPLSGGYGDEINDLDSFGFFTTFAKKWPEFHLSAGLIEALTDLIRELETFNDAPDSNQDEIEILRNPDWIRITLKLEEVVQRMKLEMVSVPSELVEEFDPENQPQGCDE